MQDTHGVFNITSFDKKFTEIENKIPNVVDFKKSNLDRKISMALANLAPKNDRTNDLDYKMAIRKK